MTIYFTLCFAVLIMRRRCGSSFIHSTASVDDVCSPHLNRHGYTNRWVIYAQDGPLTALEIASRHNFEFHGQFGNFKDFYYLSHKNSTDSLLADEFHLEVFSSHPNVLWFEQQKCKKRTKRGFFSDPLFQKQWYLNNNQAYKCKNVGRLHPHDINVIPVWNKNITGKGVVVTILDDGVEHTHPDLEKNFDFNASYDINNNDSDPIPRYTQNNINNHGTRCAGEVAASPNNKVCGVGVAFNAKLGGIRMLDGKITDAVEAESLGFKPWYVDIYSVSWGPSDDGRTVDGPGRLALKAIKDGVKYGRRNLGSIYIWATGNGGRWGDHCSCDGYINSPYTISIGAVDICGRHPWYGEECAGTIAVTYGSKSFGYYNAEITTTDLHAKCTSRHTGSSAAAPLAAGIFALVLEANPMLTWRDLQHLVVQTSKIVSPHDRGWQTNKAGFRVNPKFGFGALDTEKLIEAATSKSWRTAPPQHICTSRKRVSLMPLRRKGTITSTLTTSGCFKAKKCVTKLEHVQIVVKIQKKRYRGQLEIRLISPTQTISPILKKRYRDYSSDGFDNWEFLTVNHWGEDPYGQWRVVIRDFSASPGRLESWYLKFYGTCERPPLPFSEPMRMKVTSEMNKNNSSPLYISVALVSIAVVAVIALVTKYSSSIVIYLRKRNKNLANDTKTIDSTRQFLDVQLGERTSIKEESANMIERL